MSTLLLIAIAFVLGVGALLLFHHLNDFIGSIAIALVTLLICVMLYGAYSIRSKAREGRGATTTLPSADANRRHSVLKRMPHLFKVWSEESGRDAALTRTRAYLLSQGIKGSDCQWEEYVQNELK